jgi:hypothetical protein
MQLITKKEVKISCPDKTIMRLKSEQRLLLGRLARTKMHKKLLMESFSVSRTTVWFWGTQSLHYVSDLPRANHKFKVTIETEIMIVALRNNFGYGTARIQQRLFCAPDFELEQLEIKVQGIELSRQAINEILKKWGINGYKNKNKKAWKFFRAKYANELWQLDLKRFKFEGKKYELLVCIDDYSRSILLLHLFNHSPTIEEIGKVMKRLVEKYHPEKILTDNNPFQNSWGEWCKENNTEALFAHPYYPQDKGKVERTIRNITEEFIDLLSNFPTFFSRMEEYRSWFNEKRFHRGVKDYPANLYVKN